MSKMLVAWMVVVLTLTADSAGGVIDTPPQTVMRSEGISQEGINYREDWVNKHSDGTCSTLSADGPREFPEGMSYEPGAVARIRFKRSMRPRRVDLDAWRATDADGQTVGEPESVPYELTPKRRHGRTVAWDAVFEPIVAHHYYIAAVAVWKDRKCNARESAAWAFHLEVMP